MLITKIFQKALPFLYSSKKYLAFGVEESPTKYPIEKSRYLTMASYIHEESLKQGQPIRVLDIGCHEGMMLLYCQKNGSNVEFHGMDIRQDRLNLALERGYKSTKLQDVRSFPFPYPDGFFDVVVCSHILEHLEHPEKVLQELNRIIKEEGLLIVGVPTGLLPGILWRRYVVPLYNPLQRKEAVLSRFGHISFFSLPELRKLLRDNGFVAEDARGDHLFRSRRLFLENYKWWFDFNRWYGRQFPGILGHVTVKARFRARHAEIIRIAEVKIKTEDKHESN